MKEEDGLERQDWKNLTSSGYRLFKEGHVQQLKVSSQEPFVVKAICLPKMKKDREYSTTVILQQEPASVLEASCTCPAGKGSWGSCKHLAALCYCLEDFVKMRSTAIQLDEASCTSVVQKWNQPRKKHLDSKMVEDISSESAVFGKERKRREKIFQSKTTVNEEDISR